MHSIPESFARAMVELHGSEGVAWLDRLPTIIAGCAQQWSLTIRPPFPRLSYNYIAPALRADDTKAVLKVSFPDASLLNEIAALRLFDGHGAVQLLDTDAARGALLLEWLDPGTPLSELADDEAATSIAAGVMRQLWRPPPREHRFPSVADWAAGLGKLRERFAGATGPLPTPLVERAERLFAELMGSMGEAVLLHGDLHHHNILAAERQPWLALDPKGVVGEPAYDAGALLRNPMPRLLATPQPGRVLARRVDQLAEELAVDRARLLGWGVAQAVLSAWWSLEDHGHGWEPGIACAEFLAMLME